MTEPPDPASSTFPDPPSDDARSAASPPPLLAGKRVRILGRLSGVNRRELRRLIRRHGGVVLVDEGTDADIQVLSDDEPDSFAGLAPGQERWRVSDLWERLGLFEDNADVRRLYTPAMLANLVSVPISTVRRWYQRGLLRSKQVIYRVPYFGFAEVAAARRLAEFVRSGVSLIAIERAVARVTALVPDIEHPLDELSVKVEGRRILFRSPQGLVEPTGQLLFDFESLDADAEHDVQEESGQSPATILMARELPPNAEEILETAAALEGDDRLGEAIELYRAAMAAQGPRPDLCFQLADALYRAGDVTAARERLYMAIELDEDFVEARANLGCILAETGELELALAAFEGALAVHADYPDVHYHLARTLDEMGRAEDAKLHWSRFLELAPNSPWADEAQQRLEF